MEEQSKISTDPNREFLRRLVRRWCTTHSTAHIDRLEAVAEAAEVFLKAAKSVDQNEKLKLDAMKNLKKRLRELNKQLKLENQSKKQGDK